MVVRIGEELEGRGWELIWSKIPLNVCMKHLTLKIFFKKIFSLFHYFEFCHFRDILLLPLGLAFSSVPSF